MWKTHSKYGAEVINEGGGETMHTFFYPAVLYPVNNKMRVYYEEQFGPVVPIVPYEKEEEAIQYVLDSNFGQQLSLFGKNSKSIAKMIDAFSSQVGRINLNTQCQRGPIIFRLTEGKILQKAHCRWMMLCVFSLFAHW
ncbi:MAG: aldehyde dehydrogenase family protein [Cytophagales bacterium]|nr:aldehyde dehydrogenase family protein [Cytophagales bacterium]